MSQGFITAYMAGGKIDNLPYPLFPRKKVPHIVGRKVSIPPTQGIYTDSYTITKDCEYLCIAVASSVYTIGDFWELLIDGKRVCETIYMKGLPESIAVGNTMVLVYPIASGKAITFTYNNAFNIEKEVFYNLHFLE